MSSEFGHLLKISVFGQSHGAAIGVVMDGLPAGEAVDLEALQAFLDRRRPGKNALSTLERRRTAPLPLRVWKTVSPAARRCAPSSKTATSTPRTIRSSGTSPGPATRITPRLSSGGGQADMRGGGHFSGRLTAPLCIAGGIAKQILARRGIFVGAHLASVGTETTTPSPSFPRRSFLTAVAAKPFPVLNDAAGERMQSAILAAREGGILWAASSSAPPSDFPPDWAEPMFDGVENRLAAALFGIPAVKGVEFGAGFAAARSCGSDNNDPFTMDDGRVVTEHQPRRRHPGRHHQRYAR